MTTRSKAVALALTACAALSAHRPASAAVMHYTASQSISCDPLNGCFDVQPFDQALGKLVSVDLSAQASDEEDYLLENYGDNPGTVTLDMMGTLTVQIGSLFAQSPLTHSTYSQTVPAQDFEFISGYLDFPALSATTRDVSAFLDGSLYLFPSSDIRWSYKATDPEIDLSNSDVYHASGAYVGGTLTYNYTVGTVPEPATWALMIGGFGLVGGAMRTVRHRTALRVA